MCDVGLGLAYFVPKHPSLPAPLLQAFSIFLATPCPLSPSVLSAFSLPLCYSHFRAMATKPDFHSCIFLPLHLQVTLK